jgi:hypothetical protein
MVEKMDLLRGTNNGELLALADRWHNHSEPCLSDLSIDYEEFIGVCVEVVVVGVTSTHKPSHCDTNAPCLRVIAIIIFWALTESDTK